MSEDDRRLYVVAVESAPPPGVDGSAGSLIMILRIALRKLGEIRKSSSTPTVAIDQVGTAITVALVHWLTARGLSNDGGPITVKSEPLH